MGRGQVWGIINYTGVSNRLKGLDQRKENIMQEGWK